MLHELAEQPLTAEQPLKCDLVMKGGITSGIVYPSTVIALKHYKYQFERIGGTSAGAIAAAATAAAQANRENDDADLYDVPANGTSYKVPKGFRLLYDKVSNWLPGDSPKKLPGVGTVSNLRNLFQTDRNTQALMDLLDALLPVLPKDGKESQAKKNPQAAGQQPQVATTTPAAAHQLPVPKNLMYYIGKLFKIWFSRLPSIAPAHWIAALVVALLVIVLVVCTFMVLFAIAFLIAPAVMAGFAWIVGWVILGIALAVLWPALHIGAAVSAFMSLPGSFYGICTGHSEKAIPNVPNFTDWLSDVLDSVAGLDANTRPLTFKMLSDKQLELKMVTSNLSHAQPYMLPDGLQDFFYHEDDMYKLFPRYIVEYMTGCPSAKEGKPALKLPDGFHFFPALPDIPVIVVARMSLSFPLLITAVPLYTLSYEQAQAYKQHITDKVPGKYQVGDLQKNWFSDGGICSNFPMCFFDAWLPVHPTFGINLVSSRQNSSVLIRNLDSVNGKGPKVGEGDDVFLPPADRPSPVEWNDIDTPDIQKKFLNQLWNFAHRIFNTAQNYRDTVQISLPSYRERSIQVRLDADEGGLNLTMPPKVITRVSNKGACAGELLGGQPAVNSPCSKTHFNFTQHQWVRFLVLMKQLENNVVSMQQVLNSPDFQGFLAQPVPCNDPRRAYPFWEGKDSEWCSDAEKRVKALQALIMSWDIDPKKFDPFANKDKPVFFKQDNLIPDPVLRVTFEL